MEKEMQIARGKRDARLINLVLDYAINNHMSLKEVDDCIEKVAEVYYSDGLIIRE